MSFRSIVPSRWRAFSRVLLLGLFVAGQGGLAFHHHGAASAASASKGATAWKKAPPADEAAPCRACDLTSRSRSSHLCSTTIILAAGSVAAVITAPQSLASASSFIRPADRAPPFC